LVGLIGASLLFANQGEPPEITSFPTKISQAATPSAVDQPDTCAGTAHGLIFNDVPGVSSAITNSNDGRLFISGTIYASDGVTPLPGALIEVWPEVPVDERQGYVLLTQIQTTSTTGRYTFITAKPQPHHTLSIHYRISYHDKCLLLMQLDIMDVSVLRHPPVRDVQSSSLIETTPPPDHIGEARLVHHGSVDIVLPVPPPRLNTALPSGGRVYFSHWRSLWAGVYDDQ
jgi:protocatechuate 3,4-dioxygenase beta subunit